ncbi:helix-turn-helix domain-containing protein [Primorskyibacter sp. 2E107]|uniref:helix-turn-helix domain-containing protein n=1 Tax=Primorskyibacter sp. 2E107 TaxID=3403458 RepID=UPI003AF946C1
MDQNSPFHPTAVGARLIALRTHHGMTRGDFAASVDIDATSYGRIEKGEKALKADMAYRIAERWGVSMDFLYRGRLTELPASLADSLISKRTTPQR